MKEFVENLCKTITNWAANNLFLTGIILAATILILLIFFIITIIISKKKNHYKNSSNEKSDRIKGLSTENINLKADNESKSIKISDLMNENNDLKGLIEKYESEQQEDNIDGLDESEPVPEDTVTIGEVVDDLITEDLAEQEAVASDKDDQETTIEKEHCCNCDEESGCCSDKCKLESELLTLIPDLKELISIKKDLLVKELHGEANFYKSDVMMAKRPQLNEFAKKVGLRNYATWTNDILREEIIKKL